MTSGVFPDFGSRCLKVDLWIRGVFKLAGHKPSRLAGNLFPLGHRPPHSLASGGQDQLGPKPKQPDKSLLRQGVGHGQNERIPLRGAGKGQRDSGVAAGRFDDPLARLKQTTPFGIPDHGCSNAAFHAIGRIAAFDFGWHATGSPLSEPIDASHRGHSDGLRIVVIDGRKRFLGSAQGRQPRASRYEERLEN